MIIARNKLKREMKKYNLDLELLNTLGSIDFPNPFERKINPFFFIIIYKIGPADSLYYGENLNYEIKVFNLEGKLIRKF